MKSSWAGLSAQRNATILTKSTTTELRKVIEVSSDARVLNTWNVQFMNDRTTRYREVCYFDDVTRRWRQERWAARAFPG
jgi:hypothetical protein